MPSSVPSVLAWLGILPASPFSAIVCDVVFHAAAPTWLPWLNLAASVFLLALAFVRPGLQPIRGYMRSMALLTLGYLILFRVEAIGAWRSWFEQGPPWQFVFGDALLELIPCLLLALGLVRSGLRPRDLFLVRGDLRAPARVPFRLRPVSWAWLGPFMTLLLAAPLMLQLIATVRPDPRLLQRAVQGLPLALAFAVYNAAQEEFRFRAVLLGQLEPVVGASQALWITSVLFGLAHWFGHPSGPVGVVMSGFAGLVWGTSMLDTRGFAWAWMIHAVLDLAIFTSLLMSGG